ncbi:hypothetical protein BDW59DRAFT_161774 [Aspergillus cavernicola]|uniref:DUF6604 domain-containing protein n=1 Tax=Aspergillus cavernicola TaxID=176166 RepID=A0ABR4IC32_9EURO
MLASSHRLALNSVKLLVYWILHASNNIIKSFPAQASIPLNTTGKITLSTLVSLSELVAKHVKPVPATIYRLFQSVIGARRQTHSLFQQLIADDPDPEIEKSNVFHEFWINGLTKAFNLLGGEGWLSGQKSATEKSDEEDEEKDGDEEEPIAKEPAAPLRRAQKKDKKGKGKKGNKPKGKGKPAIDGTALDKVPFESYRIIEDQTGIVTDYLLAVYSLVTEWSDLRYCLQDFWHDVAYKGSNSSVAGTLSNIALAMISKAESSVEADFQGMFRVSKFSLGGVGPAKPVWNGQVDIREHFMIHAYQDLLDFVIDFQKTRSGKPTKSMLEEIREWDPTLDLKRANQEGTSELASIVHNQLAIKLETVNWSVHGPWHMHRTLFGLNEFAGAITSLVMQKPGTDVRSKIHPHLVFQLQSIVDSLTVSRGWSPNGLQGDILAPPAKNFRPRRDVDLFLDRNVEHQFRGFCQSVEMLDNFFERDSMLHGNPDRHKAVSETLHVLREDFVNWLGESKYMHGLNTIPPSRFTKTNSNGLWEYSPYLCGVGLQEGLEIVHGLGMQIWDTLPEPLCLVHLHNMLVKKGYISKPIGLYATLAEVFEDAFFADGKIPESGFFQAFSAVLLKAGIFDILPFIAKSLTRLFREAYWVLDRIPDNEIPDNEIPVPSILAALRVVQTKTVFDPATRKLALQETELVKRFKSKGFTEKNIYDLASAFDTGKVRQNIPDDVRASIPLPEGFTIHGEQPSRSDCNKGGLSNELFLRIIELDLKGDVGIGLRPMLGLNYISATTHMMMVFNSMEDKLQQLRNPLWVDAYEGSPVQTRNKRGSLTLLALQEENEECLRVMAECFDNIRIGYILLSYWDEDTEEVGRIENAARETVGSVCYPVVALYATENGFLGLKSNST